MGIPSAGLKIDESARVIGATGEAIAGLYAVGNAAAQTDVGAGYNSGISNIRGLIYGQRAGRLAIDSA